MGNCRLKRDCWPCTGKKNAVKLVSNWKMNKTSPLLPSVSFITELCSTHLPGFCMFVSIYFDIYMRRFGDLIKLALNGKFQLEIIGNVFCEMQAQNLQPNWCFPACHSINVVLATCSVHTRTRAQAVWTFFSLQLQ